MQPRYSRSDYRRIVASFDWYLLDVPRRPGIHSARDPTVVAAKAHLVVGTDLIDERKFVKMFGLQHIETAERLEGVLYSTDIHPIWMVLL